VPRPRGLPITKRPPAGDLRRERRLVLSIVVVPLLGFGLALAFALRTGRVSGLELALLAGFYALTVVGIGLGYHRLFTHLSLEVARPLKAFLALTGSLAVQGPVIRWAADHRRHHMFSDRDGDPHSPHLGPGEGPLAALRKLAYAHVGWFFDDEKTVVRKFAPDLLADPIVVAVDRLYPLWIALSLGLPALIGLAWTGTAAGALGAVLWGGLVRIALMNHVTWSINSICHYFGARPFRTGDESCNNWVLAIPSFGEAWHNNHHAFPASAFHGLRWWQVDVTGLLIRLLEALGLAWNVKRVKADRMARKACAGGAPREAPAPGAAPRSQVAIPT